MSGGREGAVRVWDAAGAEGADVLAALGAGASAQVLADLQLSLSYCNSYFQVVGLGWTDTNSVLVTAVESPSDL